MTTAFEAIRRFDELNHKLILEEMLKTNGFHQLEETLDSLEYKKVNVFTIPEGPPAYINEVLQLCRTNQKIPAIKCLREATGCMLKEGKDVVCWLMGQDICPNKEYVDPFATAGYGYGSGVPPQNSGDY